MADSLELPALYVEGDTDLHTVVHLLRRHGVVLDKDVGPVIIKKAKNDRGVLESMRTAAKASTLRPVGFIIDADKPVAFRWQSICDHLKDLGLILPSSAPASGYIGDSTETRSRVGVWIMPDNKMDEGCLEHLVQTLVPADDQLISLAQSSTAQAVRIGVSFGQADLIKAELHCWLAWQKEPGLSFGTALKTQYFRHDSEVAIAFIAWFKSLYGL
jgi:hypothetical protein